VALVTGAAWAAAVPLPKPRPLEAPKLVQPTAPVASEKAATDKPAAPEAAQPSACRLALTEAIAIAPSLSPINGPGACGGEDIVRLEAVVLADNSRVPLKPAATLRCNMATAVAQWIRSDVAAIAAGLGTNVRELDNFDSFDCRGRNRVAGARMSEHGRANALDVRGVRFANGQFVSLTDRATARDVREKMLQSVCARFTTVLGPGSDGYHEDHIHLDLAERRNGYRICQWQIWEGLPKIAPLLPAGRPEEAPPRVTAERAPQEPVDAAPKAEQKAEQKAAPAEPKPAQPPVANALRPSLSDQKASAAPVKPEPRAKSAEPQSAPAKKRRSARRAQPSPWWDVLNPHNKKGTGLSGAFR
jgi:hypothetical protein